MLPTMNHAALDIHPLSPERPADFPAFFDGEAFADNPQWAFCCCQITCFVRCPRR
jgi:hypothetical protein